ncbi:diguanylate cyclase [Halobacillus locisalis]|uniref:Diguanylate cyclase n=1 Tax=Halobacillus locisalis TaxID=220753 RepID=A0A838CSR1_9BACI|nr:diguanylate cyclase [Halobacillus locisalis]MBA2174805.1 diguanylate cyclase [Halobacillus locisalis]
MNWLDPYIYFLSGLGLIVLYLSLVLMQPPRKLSRTLLAFAAGLSGVFILLTVFELVSDDPGVMLWLRNLQQVTLIVAPIFVFGYAMELRQEAPRKTIRLISLLLIPSVIDTILIFTDSWHGWMRESVTVVKIWNYTEVSIESTFLNGFFGSYTFVIAVLTILLLIRNMFDVPKQFRKTHGLSALVVALPIVSILVMSSLPFEVPATFALSYSFMALLLIVVNKQMDFNAIWPVSRQEVLENLTEGIFLIDQQGKVIEFNSAAFQMIRRLFDGEKQREDVLHQAAAGTFQEVPELLQALGQKEDASFEYSRSGSYFNVDVRLLGEKSNHLRLVVWNDITDQKKVEHQLKELADLDPLTRLTNRRAFIDLYHDTNLEDRCFLLLDIDHFKNFNDKYGHMVGDDVLKHVSHLMKTCFTGAVLTRLGGEEFGILVDTRKYKAVNLAEAFQEALKEETCLINPIIEEEVTVSIGICEVVPGTPFEKAYQLADDAMYKAKSEGRDRIQVT